MKSKDRLERGDLKLYWPESSIAEEIQHPQVTLFYILSIIDDLYAFNLQEKNTPAGFLSKEVTGQRNHHNFEHLIILQEEICVNLFVIINDFDKIYLLI